VLAWQAASLRRQVDQVLTAVPEVAVRPAAASDVPLTTAPTAVGDAAASAARPADAASMADAPSSASAAGAASAASADSADSADSAASAASAASATDAPSAAELARLRAAIARPASAAALAASGGASATSAPMATATPTPDREPPALRLARALALAAADDDRALALYHPLQQGSGPLARAARYNAANLLMRQGLALRQGPQPGQAIALIELAKQQYRAVLREDPSDWDARYNLERAQRLLPEPDETEVDPAVGPKQSERAVTTMRAFSPGLP
jgi:mxaK protein